MKPRLILALAALVCGLLTSCSSAVGVPAPSDTPTAPGSATQTATPSTTPARAPSASTTPSATVTPSASETAAPAPIETRVPDSAPAAIYLDAENLYIIDTNGTSLLSLPFASDGIESTIAISTALGAPLRTEREEATAHYPAADIWVWEGFAVVVNRYDQLDNPPPPSNYYTEYYVVVDLAETSAGISIATLDGTQVGDSFEEVAADKSALEVYRDPSFHTNSVTIDLPDSFPGLLPDWDVPTSWGVIGVSNKNSTTIDRIFAPQLLQEPF